MPILMMLMPRRWLKTRLESRWFRLITSRPWKITQSFSETSRCCTSIRKSMEIQYKLLLIAVPRAQLSVSVAPNSATSFTNLTLGSLAWQSVSANQESLAESILPTCSSWAVARLFKSLWLCLKTTKLTSYLAWITWRDISAVLTLLSTDFTLTEVNFQ